MPAAIITYPYRYASFVVPNASCPVCGEPVFFYCSPAGGRVFFDNLGPPWPKHPCTDNGATPTYRTQGNERSVWAKDGWQPLSIEEVEWGINGAIVRGQTMGEDGDTPVAFRCGVAEAESIGSLAAVRWTNAQNGILSTAGHDGQAPIDFAIKRLDVDTKMSERAHKALVKADAKAFFEATTADWDIMQPLRGQHFPGSVKGFRRGLPVLAVFLDSDEDLMLMELVKEWFDSLVIARGGDAFSEAAWRWDRLIAPVLIVGSREDADLDIVADYVGYGDLMPAIEAYRVSSVTGVIRPLPTRPSTLLDGQLHEFLQLPTVSPEAYINVAYVRELAVIRRVDGLLAHFMAAMKVSEFRLNFTRTDMRIQFCRGDDDAIDLWLAYSDPRRGLLVTLSAEKESPLIGKSDRWPGELGPADATGLLTDAPTDGRVSRWLATEEAIGRFAGQLGTGPLRNLSMNPRHRV